MQISQALQQNKQKLTKTSHTSELDAEVLLCFVLNKPKEYLYTYPEYELTQKEEETYLNCIKKRLSGAPIAHITGFKEFYGREFIVTPNTLVPRPETELFIDYITHNTQHLTYDTTFIDIGTGSGCIVVTIAKELNSCSHGHKFYAVDISEKALDIAKQNAKKHGVDDIVNFYHGNLLEPLLCHSGANAIESHKLTMNPNQRDPISRLSSFQNDSSIVITANLPYLTPEQIKNAPSIHAEPELALVAGDDGLKYYNELFKQVHHICTPGRPLLPCNSPCHCEKEPKRHRGNPINQTPIVNSRDCHVAPTPRNDSSHLTITILCEIDDSQASSIINLAKQELPNFSIKIKKDLAGLSRMVVISN